MGISKALLSAPLTPPTTQKAVQDIIARSRLTAAHSEAKRCLSSLSLLQCDYTDTEPKFIVLESSSPPILQILRYQRSGTHTTSPCTFEPYVFGLHLEEVRNYLTGTAREKLEQQLQSLRCIVAEHRSFSFGPAGLVKAGRGFSTWREAFTVMFESVLMDGEAVTVNIPYRRIREAINRWDTYLDDVSEACLIVPGLCEPENVMIDSDRNEVTGLLDLGSAFWGDIAMMDVRGDEDIKRLL